MPDAWSGVLLSWSSWFPREDLIPTIRELTFRSDGRSAVRVFVDDEIAADLERLNDAIGVLEAIASIGCCAPFRSLGHVSRGVDFVASSPSGRVGFICH